MGHQFLSIYTNGTCFNFPPTNQPRPLHFMTSDDACDLTTDSC